MNIGRDQTMDDLLTGLRAVAEPTRLRMLALCRSAELNVSDFVQILGQSQPRVSRHLKLLCEAGLLSRSREGSWAFYRLADDGLGAELARRLLSLLPEEDSSIQRDRERLNAVMRSRAEAASAYFRENAERWNGIRSLHVDEGEVERALLNALPRQGIVDLLDIGTGTGRILELVADRVGNAVGIDTSREMLTVARANLDRAGLGNCALRQGDMYQLPMPGGSFDAVTIHQVLHFADRPAAAIAEAARVLRPGGRLVVVDFAPHELESLREEHAHRRLGFADAEITEWCRVAGLAPEQPIHLPGHPLTVTVWLARRPVEEPAETVSQERMAS